MTNDERLNQHADIINDHSKTLKEMAKLITELNSQVIRLANLLEKSNKNNFDFSNLFNGKGR